jgi:hypothetical protein
MRLKKIQLGEHVFGCGMTGSGKTFTLENYLVGERNVIVHDTKGTFSWKGLSEDIIIDNLNDLQYFKEGKAIYRPRFEELEKEYYEEFYKWIYFRQNCIVYQDEIMSVSDNSTYVPMYAKAILTRGRERKTSMWGATQRPKTIPLVYMSEATHFFIFKLQLDADRKRVQEIIPHDEILVDIPKRQFWYFNTEMDKPVLARLVPKEGGVK